MTHTISDRYEKYQVYINMMHYICFYYSMTNNHRSDVPMFSVSSRQPQPVMQRDSFVEWRAIAAEMRTRRVEGYGRSVDVPSLHSSGFALATHSDS